MESENIKLVEEHYNAKYVGRFGLDRRVFDTDIMGDVFYVENPDTSKGHSNYFALFRDAIDGKLFITNAEKVAEKTYPALFINGKRLEPDWYCSSVGRAWDS